MLAAATVRAVPPVPMPPDVDVRLRAGVVISPDPALVMLPLAVSETEVVPLTAPLSEMAPALEVRPTVCALMVPAAELVRLPAVATTVKLVAAAEAPEIFVATPPLMFTSWPAALALALMLAAETVSAVPPVPTLPAVDVTFNVGVVIVPKLAFVIPALAVKPTDVVPVIAPLNAREPALDVRLTVCALIVPAAELVRLPAVVPTVKVVPAPDAPEIFVVAALVTLTSCPAALALALMFAAETVSAVPAVPTLPAVDVTFKVGVVIVPKLAFVMPALAVNPTEVVPVMAPLRPSAPAVDVRLTVCALIVPAAALVRLPEDDNETVPMVPAPAARFPATFRVPAPTVSAKVEPFPADDAFKLTAAAVSLAKLTLPVELAVRVEALIVFAPPNMIPAVPPVKLAVAALSEPAAVIPLAASLAFNIKEEPELAFNAIAPVLVSIILTAPAEFAARLLALMVLAPVKLMPPVPAVRLAVAAFNTAAPVMPLPAWLAFNVNDVPELPFKVIPAAFVSTILTAPVEFAVIAEAVVEPVPLIVMPPVPELAIKEAVVSVLVEEIEPPPPVVADIEMTPAALRGDVNATSPDVEVRSIAEAVILLPIEAELIVLAAAMLT